MKFKFIGLYIIIFIFSSNLSAGLIDSKVTNKSIVKYTSYKKLKTFPYPFVSIDRRIAPALKWNLKDNLITTLIQKSTVALFSIQIIKSENDKLQIITFWANGSHHDGVISIKESEKYDTYKRLLPTCDIEYDDCLL